MYKERGKLDGEQRGVGGRRRVVTLEGGACDSQHGGILQQAMVWIGADFYSRFKKSLPTGVA